MEGKNVFLTGKAGTGKSFVVKEAIKALKQAKRKIAAVAPTGIAANNIDGQTIHSLFSLNPFGVMNYENCNFLKSGARKVLDNIDVLFIDEVSMLRPDILDGIHLTFKKNGLKGLDSRQVVFVGDLKQLPPILDDNTRSVLYRTYDGHTFYDAMVFKKLDVHFIELTEVMRQTDTEFIDNLNIIREGGKSEYFRRFVTDKPQGIILAPYNATVQAYNEAGLQAQEGDLFKFEAEMDGVDNPEEFGLERTIKVKNGCKIMYLVNSKDNPLRNGTLGIFVSHNNCHYIKVGNVDYNLEPVTITKKKYVYDANEDELVLKEIGSIKQYPFKLAYALSIHKAQGLTFDQVTVDLRRPCFQDGQLYVALSRVKTPEGLGLIIN
jgi:ATP-dependent exoDNAse (exonuclease V) alpha subunit